MQRTAAKIPLLLAGSILLTSPALGQAIDTPGERPRARELGIAVGVFQPGRYNAITDVDGVLVGQTTVLEGDSIRTGVTAVLPHRGNVFEERVPAALRVINGFGKILGVTQLRELGEIETPILLTCTLCVWRAADAMVDWLLLQRGMENVRSINPIVGETNDGYLNDIRLRPIRREHVVRALESADGGAVEEGAVGAGTGTSAFGWKGGIGTSSRVLPERYGGYRVGVLVQSNFGGILTIAGAPVGRELGRYMYRPRDGARARPDDEPALAARRTPEGEDMDEAAEAEADDEEAADGMNAPGSIMIVVATDAPLNARLLERLATRAAAGLARTGGSFTNGSGEYVIAFSTAESVRRRAARAPLEVDLLPNEAMSPLFQAVAEATEEAIYNSMLRAETVSGHRGTIEALPIEGTLEVLRRYGVVED